MANPVTRWQILTRDPDQHAAFYTAVFGWSIRSDNALGYRVAQSGSARGIGGGFWPAPSEAHAFVQLFAEVEDMDATIRRATEHGGSVLIPPQTLPDGETMAILRDPMGVTFGVVLPVGQ